MKKQKNKVLQQTDIFVSSYGCSRILGATNGKSFSFFRFRNYAGYTSYSLISLIMIKILMLKLNFGSARSSKAKVCF